MKIGVDARSLMSPLTGIGRYTLEMCKALSKMPGVSLYLYSAFKKGSVVTEVGNTHNRAHYFYTKVIRQFWPEFYLPFETKKDQLDIFWGPSHRLPIFLGKNIPQVVSIHDLTWKYFSETMKPTNYWLERIYMPRALAKATCVIASSEATASDVRREFPGAHSKLYVIHHGVTQFDPASSELKKDLMERPFFLFVGTVEPRKNLHRLLSAYAALPEEVRKKASLVIAGGSGWGEVNIIEKINSLGLHQYVHWLGYVDDAQLAELYKRALFLAMPSLYEGFGLPLIEAMSQGIPVLSSNTSSMPEVVADGGLLIDPLDVGSIQQGLHSLIMNSKLRDELAIRAKANVDRFKWDIAAEKLFEVFKETIFDHQNSKLSCHKESNHV